MLQAVQDRRGPELAEIVAAGSLDDFFEPFGGVGRTAQCGRQVRIVAARLTPPNLCKRRGKP